MPSRTFLVTFANQRPSDLMQRRVFDKQRATAAHFGYNYVVLGWGLPYYGHSSKLFHFNRFLQRPGARDDDIHAQTGGVKVYVQTPEHNNRCTKFGLRGITASGTVSQADYVPTRSFLAVIDGALSTPPTAAIFRAQSETPLAVSHLTVIRAVVIGCENKQQKCLSARVRAQTDEMGNKVKVYVRVPRLSMCAKFCLFHTTATGGQVRLGVATGAPTLDVINAALATIPTAAIFISDMEIPNGRQSLEEMKTRVAECIHSGGRHGL
jgi:hypothetical protein